MTQTKRTHKLGAIGDAAAVVGRSASVTAAARELGVDRSSVHRWILAGHVPRPGGRVRLVATRSSRSVEAVPGDPVPPELPDVGWAEWARTTYELSANEKALVDLADRALRLARDEGQRPELQLAAMNRFQALVKQLQFEDPKNGEAETTAPGDVRDFSRRAG